MIRRSEAIWTATNNTVLSIFSARLLIINRRLLCDTHFNDRWMENLCSQNKRTWVQNQRARAKARERVCVCVYVYLIIFIWVSVFVYGFVRTSHFGMNYKIQFLSIFNDERPTKKSTRNWNHTHTCTCNSTDTPLKYMYRVHTFRVFAPLPFFI